jgi:selenocysteine-specific elongation factor
MVAGATGIDLFLLVVDAAEGARPQTHEHLAILRLLGIERGVVAITKVDAVDDETRLLAIDEGRELVPGAPVVATSARTGEGLDDLVAALAETADLVERRPPLDATRLFVDRSFSLRGIGTVVTGTLWSGSIGEGDELVVEPSGQAVRVRSVQVHDSPVDRAGAGQRVAVALPGIERSRVRRGDALVARGAYPVSYRLDVTLAELEPIADGARVHVHHGTAEHFARVVRVGEHHAQLRLGSRAIAARGDRLVLRDGTTLGGALVLDPSPPRRPSEQRLLLLEQGDPASVVAATLNAAGEPLTRRELARRALLTESELSTGLEGMVTAGEYSTTDDWLEGLRTDVARRLAERAARSPLDPGIPLAELLPQRPWAVAIVPLLPLERRGANAFAPGTSAHLGDHAEAADALQAQLAESGFTPIKVDDRQLALFLEREGAIVRLGDDFVLSASAYARARDLLVAECEEHGRITLARFRDLIGAGRRATQLLLERFDSDGLTRRSGDERVLRRRAH